MLSKKVTHSSSCPNNSFEGVFQNLICYKILSMLVLSIEKKFQVSYMLNLLKGDYELDFKGFPLSPNKYGEIPFLVHALDNI